MNALEEALRQELLAALDWEPRLAGSRLDVSVARDGVIGLSGVVKSYADKVAAERTVKRVRGVRVVVDDIDVKLPSTHARSDTELGDAVVAALTRDVLVPHERIWARVSDGWVRLEGTVDWNYQRTAAEEAVHRLTGVKRVSNLIAVRPEAADEDAAARETVKEGIEAALKRSAELEANNIEVEAHHGKVVLRGQVNSWAEREAAEAAAWAARGVATVEDRLEVSS